MVKYRSSFLNNKVKHWILSAVQYSGYFLSVNLRHELSKKNPLLNESSVNVISHLSRLKFSSLFKYKYLKLSTLQVPSNTYCFPLILIL